MESIVDNNGVGIVYSLKNKIKEIQAQIEVIQTQCSHPVEAVTSEHKSNTGNYDPSADRYWINHHCHLCDKKWSVDQ